MHPKREKIRQSKIRLFPNVGRPIKKKVGIRKKDIRPVPSFSMKVGKKVRINTHVPVKNKSEPNRYHSIDHWAGILEGHTAFLLGNAPSIGKVDLNILDPYFTIGINRIFYIYDPTILMWQDRQIWSRDKRGIERQKAIKISTAASDPRNLYMHFKIAANKFNFTYSPSGLCGRGNTGVLAAQLSVALGCTNLVLLGMDCKYSSEGKTDFYGKNQDHKPYTLRMCRSAMEWLRDHCPVPIYNCSDTDLWPKRDLVDVIEELNSSKMSRSDYYKVLLK